ncbi:MAG: L,D-transpeptidase family protein [Desulfobulbaceae bacterium]
MVYHRALLACVCLLALFFLPLCPVMGNTQVDDPVQLALLDIMATKLAPGTEPALARPGDLTIQPHIMELYTLREMRPLWVNLAGPGDKALIIANALNGSFDEGLNPADYFVPAISRLWPGRNPLELAQLDILLTQGLSAYLTDMAFGRAEPCLLDPQLFATAREDVQNDPGQLIRQASEAPDLERFIQDQAPAHEAYRLLRTALARYRAIADQGGWPHIPPGPSIKPDKEDPRIPAVRTLLTINGDYSGADDGSLLLDPDLVTAVQRFQIRHNLNSDGIIGKNTLAAMNVPVTERIDQILINMELWRWLPHKLEGKQLFVNIAGFYLQARQDEQVEFATPVIVGKVYHKTPVFSDLIRYLEFNPFWNIPSSIARKEIVPEMLKDPAYLRNNNIRMFAGWDDNGQEVDPAALNWRQLGKQINRYRLRQDPGPDNALGRVKFVFPNQHDVYLHDTPAHELFRRDDRAFSHGCIRVSRPIELARYLLSADDQSWTMERIQKILEEGKRTVILLKKPVPIHILYRTVAVDQDSGMVSFFKDVYGRDALLRQALFPQGSGSLCRYPPVSR